MIKTIQLFTLVATLLCSGCATSSVKKTWKAPDYKGGPVQKICVLAVDERGLVRKGFENRFVRDLEKEGQPAIVTHDALSLQEIKASKETAAAQMTGAGADSVLLVRLVDQTTYSHSTRATGERYVGVTTGFGSDYGYYGWYDYYTVAFMDMGTVWSTTKQKLFFDASLYDLKTGRRLWSALMETTLKEDADRLVEADSLVAKVVTALHQDGMVR